MLRDTGAIEVIIHLYITLLVGLPGVSNNDGILIEILLRIQTLSVLLTGN